MKTIRNLEKQHRTFIIYTHPNAHRPTHTNTHARTRTHTHNGNGCYRLTIAPQDSF